MKNFIIKDPFEIFLKSTGLLGRAILKHFENEASAEVPEEKCQYKWNVIGTYNTRVRKGLQKLDLTKFDEVEKFINEFKVIYS